MHLYAASACKRPNRLTRQLTMTNPAHDVATVELSIVKTNAILVTLDLRATKRWKNSLCLLVMLYSIDSGIYALDESHVANIITMACNAALDF